VRISLLAAKNEG
jgi:hypothetical protein